MRLTDSMISRNYLTHLNQSLNALNNCNERLSSERNYLKASDDPSTAMKAFEVRKNLSRIDIFQTNISDAGSVFTEEESVISSIKDILDDAVTQIEQGETGTYNAEDREVIASTLRSYQEQILGYANSKYSGDYLFGGNNVSDVPFTVDSSGHLFYNSQNIDTGTFQQENRYLDVGLGFVTDASGDVVPGTALDMAYAGTTLLGSGTDSNGITNNIYNLLGDIAEQFENNDLTNLSQYSDKLDQKIQDVMLQYVSIGEKSSFMKSLSTRYENDEVNAKTKQSELEAIDQAKGAVEFNELKTAYNAALQMGLEIMQPSLLDYLD